jgi:cleavage stimulation factor subunit 3
MMIRVSVTFRVSVPELMCVDARALFESIVRSLHFKAEALRSVWARWLNYESQYGTLDATLRVQQRMAEVFTSGEPTVQGLYEPT